MSKTKKKRTVTCGKCNGTGHNARTCPEDAKETAKVDAPVVPDDAGKIINKEVKQQRPAPTADLGSKASAAPFRCEKCNAVGILVIVRVKDYNATFKQKKDVFMGDLRCEHCMNTPQPAEFILKWGAMPGEKIDAETANG